MLPFFKMFNIISKTAIPSRFKFEYLVFAIYIYIYMNVKNYLK